MVDQVINLHITAPGTELQLCSFLPLNSISLSAFLQAADLLCGVLVCSVQFSPTCGQMSALLFQPLSSFKLPAT